MNSIRSSNIDRLLDELSAAVESENNQSREKISPVAGIGIEEPIAWTKLFGYDVNEYLSDPEFYFEQTLRQKLWRWNNVPDDMIKLTLDVPAWLGHYPEYTYAGMDVFFNSQGVPMLQTDHPLSKNPDMSLLKPVNFHSSGWMPRVLKWYDDLKRIANGRVHIPFNMTWWRGGLDLAIHLRGYDNFIMDTIERPKFVHELMKFITEQRCLWHSAYWEHFGIEKQPAAIGDDWVNVPFISPSMFEEFVLPYYMQIERFHGTISYIHSCGNQTPIQQYLLKLSSLMTFEVSPWTNLDRSLINIPSDKWLSVALHPNEVLCTTPANMETKLQEIVEKCSGRQYWIGTSGLTPITDNPQDYIDRIRTWTKIAALAMSEIEPIHSGKIQ